jgi:hypothetical protein
VGGREEAVVELDTAELLSEPFGLSNPSNSASKLSRSERPSKVFRAIFKSLFFYREKSLQEFFASKIQRKFYWRFEDICSLFVKF